MGKQTKICGFILATGALFAIIALVFQQREPRYQGRSLSDWLTICRSSETSQSERAEAATAVRQIGTRGLNLLVTRASQDTWPMKEKIKVFLQNHPNRILPKSVWDWANKPQDYIRANEARIGLIILGPAAAPAIPELTRLASACKVNSDCCWAMEALGDIGPPALPALLGIAQNPSSPVRAYAVSQFRKFGTNALVALPTLIRCLDDADIRLAHSSATALGDLRLDPDSSIPALIKCLHANDLNLKRIAADSIAAFGPAAAMALPDLREAASMETDPSTRYSLRWTLHKMDPNAPAPSFY